MGWTTPADIVTGHTVTASEWNDAVGETGNTKYLYDNRKGKVIWVPATYLMQAGSDRAIDDVGYFPAAYMTTADDEAAVSFWCPSDFSAITEAYLLVIPKATQGSANWDTKANYAAVGEAYNTHSETNTASTYNVTDDQLFKVDVSDILTGLAADDFCGITIQIKDSAHDAALIGFWMKYT